MHVTLVHVYIKPEYTAAFQDACRLNHEGSTAESGNRRFDILQDANEATHFVLYEAYASPEDAAAHKQTAHYLAWRDTVARVEAELLGPDGGVYRYGADTFYGGGQWPVLTAAYGLACLRRDGSGDRARAEAALAWIEEQRDARSRLPEQSHRYVLAPAKLPEWEARWGPVATPLTWSHAMTLLLARALAERAEIYVAQNARDHASKLLYQAYDITRKAVGNDHPRAKRIRKRLVELYRALGWQKKIRDLPK